MAQTIADGLFRVEGERAVLIGSRRRPGDPVKFPAESDVLLDGEQTLETVELATEGILYTFTTQEFAPPLPFKGKRAQNEFKPYVVGYVELSQGLLVESILVGVDVDELRIGQRMVSTTTTLETEDGQALQTYAFTRA